MTESTIPFIKGAYLLYSENGSAYKMNAPCRGEHCSMIQDRIATGNPNDLDSQRVAPPLREDEELERDDKKTH